MPPVLKSFVHQLTSVQSLINFDPSTQVRLMESPTRLLTSPISLEGSTVLLSPDRGLLPGSPDHGGILQRLQIDLGLQIILVRPDNHRSSRDRQIDDQPGLCLQPETCHPDHLITRGMPKRSQIDSSSPTIPTRPDRYRTSSMRL